MCVTSGRIKEESPRRLAATPTLRRQPTLPPLPYQRYLTLTGCSGCRAGEACPFLHVAQPQVSGGLPADARRSATQDDVGLEASQPGPQDARNADVAPQVSKVTRVVVSRPVPIAQHAADPRGFQIRQLQSKFSPAISQSEHGTVLVFKLVPSDPDFPFELDGLRCTLTVPEAYPRKDAKPTLRVTNPEMERGCKYSSALCLSVARLRIDDA